MKDIIEIYDGHGKYGIKNRTITEGKEIELVREYISYRKETFRACEDKKMAIFLESKVSNAYPDIVFVEYNPENYLDWPQVRTKLEKVDLKILYHVYAMGELNFNDIVNQLGVTWKEASLAIERLCDSRLVKRESGSWKIYDCSKISTSKIEAVEAKMNQWDQVLQQSIINKNFASESFALSIAKSKPNKEVLNKFKKFGIGVCLKNGDNFEIIKKAKRVNIPVSYNSIVFNEWIGRILNCSEDGELNDTNKCSYQYI